jgi:putative membrane protein
MAFYLGVSLIYCTLQTKWDCYAGHMFFVHRLQHLILHDVGPAMLAASAPAAELGRGLPQWLSQRVPQVAIRLRPAARMIFDPWTATGMYIATWGICRSGGSSSIRDPTRSPASNRATAFSC